MTVRAVEGRPDLGPATDRGTFAFKAKLKPLFSASSSSSPSSGLRGTDFERACGRGTLPAWWPSTRAAGRQTPTPSWAGSRRRRGPTAWCAWGWRGERPPAAGGASAGGVSGAAGDRGGTVPGLHDAVCPRRPAAAAGDVSGLWGRRARPPGRRGSGPAGPAAVQRVADPESEAMTLRLTCRLTKPRTGAARAAALNRWAIHPGQPGIEAC